MSAAHVAAGQEGGGKQAEGRRRASQELKRAAPGAVASLVK